MFTSPRFVLAAALAALAAFANAAPFSDDFSLSQAPATNSFDTGFGTMPSVVSFAPGLQRAIFCQNLANELPGDARSRVSISGGVFGYSSDAEVTGYGIVGYVFDVSGDMTQNGDFSIEVLSNDLPGTLSVIGSDVFGNTSEKTILLPAISSPTTFTLTDVFAGIDATQINAFFIRAGGTQAEDLKIGGFQAVPEPTTVAALGLGAVAVLRRRKRA